MTLTELITLKQQFATDLIIVAASTLALVVSVK